MTGGILLANQRIVFAPQLIRMGMGKLKCFAWRKSDVSKQAKALVLDCKRIGHLRVLEAEGISAYKQQRVQGEKEKMRVEKERESLAENMSSLLLNDYVDRPVHYQRILTFFLLLSRKKFFSFRFEEFRHILFLGTVSSISSLKLGFLNCFDRLNNSEMNIIILLLLVRAAIWMHIC